MNNSIATNAALAGVLALTLLNVAQAADEKPEKCYGVVKAGQNDCQTNTSACAGQSTQDGQGDAWIYVPKGTCDKIVGGSTTAKS